MITIWFPEWQIPFIDHAAKLSDTDRSKYIRQSVREKLALEGIPCPKRAPEVTKKTK